MITYTDFRRLLTDASECATFDEFVAECGGSIPLTNLGTTLMLLKAIYDIGHDGLTVRKLCEVCLPSQRQLAIRYGIPVRTVEDWCAGHRSPAPAMLPLIAYAVVSDYIGDIVGETW